MKDNMRRILALKNKQRGTTLLEVVISIFVVAFGLLAFVAVQLRVQTSVREAAYMTVVSNATENLMEGMLANPKVYSPDARSFFRSYAHYTDVASNAECNYVAANSNADALACEQVKQFKNNIEDSIVNAHVEVVVCPDVAGAGDLPIAAAGNAGAVDNFMACNTPAGGNLTRGNGNVIRVAWFIQDSALNAGDGGLSTEVKGGEVSMVYAYQLEVAQ